MQFFYHRRPLLNDPMYVHVFVATTGNFGGQVLTGDTDHETLNTGVGNNYFFGDGNTTVSYANSPNGVNLDLAHGTTSNGYGGTDTLTNIQSIIGSSYDDTFLSGSGFDLTGGAGADTFAFAATALADAQVATPVFDRITDYDQGNTGSYSPAEGDHIDLSALLSSAYALGSGQAVGSLVRLVANSSGATLEIDPDGTANGSNWLTIGHLDGIHPGNQVNVILDASQPMGVTITMLLPPTVAISNAGGLTNQARQMIGGTVAPRGAAIGATAVLYDNGNQIGTATVGADGTWNTPVTLVGDGGHTLVAVNLDAAGDLGTSSPVVYTLDTTPPSLTPVANQTDEATGPSGAVATFSATATDLVDGTDPVTFKERNNIVHSGDSFSLGVHAITASATDAAGNTGSENFTITVQDTTPPSLVHEGTLPVTVDATATIPSSLLQFDDNVSIHAQETYAVITPPLDGTLLKSGSPTSSFTQADIDNGLITYHETASNASSDSFTFTVTDAASNTTVNDTFQIQIAPNPTAFAIFDVTTGVQSLSEGTPYSGPVAGLVDQFIYTEADNLNVAAGVPNTFIHTGSGEDAIDVSHVSGTNVLDGGTNSNFLVGGTGPSSFDTFFVDDRSPSADIWSTVANFHTGDAATIFGITPDGFNTAWVDGQGATGYTGLTLHVTAPGVPTASLTLSGYTTADLTNGRLTTSYGTENDGTPYLYVHGN
jgi:hypothetical protein